MMNRMYWVPVLGLAAGLMGCKALEVTNPNAPERERAFSDPATLVSTAKGTMKSFSNMRMGDWCYLTVCDDEVTVSQTLSAMADSYTASWNNHQNRYYSSYGPGGGANCPDRCAWVNNTAATPYRPLEGYWYGSYSVLSSANDALFAIRLSENPPSLGVDAARVETIAQMAQAMAHAWIALNYDRGFVVTEDTDLAAIELVDRAEIRDAALDMLEAGIALAKSSSFSTGNDWFGVVSSPVYTNLQLAKIMRTMQAELLAHYPRTAEENVQVDWAKVATYASQGISSSVDGAPFDFQLYQDENGTFGSFFGGWSNDYTTFRVDTRVARLMSTTQKDPWPGGAGSLQPADGAGNPIGGVYGVDKRLGDGCFDAGTGEADLYGYGECAETANSGTDYMWSPVAIFSVARGQYHQSNIGHIRDRCLAALGFVAFPDCPTGATLFDYYHRGFNDLLWAEALIRTGNLGTAATLINNTRVGRGGLPACSAAGCPTVPPSGLSAKDQLLAALNYEQEVELIRTGGTAFFNQRRYSKTTYGGPSGTNMYTADGKMHLMDPEGPWVWNTIWKDTPRQMPIPAKDLALLKQELYTFGGAGNPGGVSPPSDPGVGRVQNVREIWAQMSGEGQSRSRISTLFSGKRKQ